MARANLRRRIGPAALVALGLMLLPALWSAGSPAGAVPATGTLGVSTTHLTLPTTTATLPTTVTLPPTTATTTPRVTVPVTVPTTKVPNTVSGTTSTTAATTTTTTSTTIAPIPTVSPAPITLPLATEPQSATISPVFSVLSLLGFITLVGLLIAQWYLTGPNRRGPTL